MLDHEDCNPFLMRYYSPRDRNKVSAGNFFGRVDDGHLQTGREQIGVRGSTTS